VECERFRDVDIDTFDVDSIAAWTMAWSLSCLESFTGRFFNSVGRRGSGSSKDAGGDDGIVETEAELDCLGLELGIDDVYPAEVIACFFEVCKVERESK